MTPNTDATDVDAPDAAGDAAAYPYYLCNKKTRKITWLPTLIPPTMMPTIMPMMMLPPPTLLSYIFILNVILTPSQCLNQHKIKWQ